MITWWSNLGWAPAISIFGCCAWLTLMAGAGAGSVLRRIRRRLRPHNRRISDSVFPFSRHEVR